jgi:tRNA U34 5-methylaminomethyl-2-thiouridine-forming methyltransferase MnmC
MHKVEVIITKDGSSSLFVPSLDETYHSRHGAITESVHVYIQHGLYERVESANLSTVDIFEVGFGTGLNTLLTILACLKRDITLNYTTIEPFPLDKATLDKLNYHSLLSQPEANDWFNWLHNTEWDQIHSRGKISFIKTKDRLETFHTEKKFEIVYFDAFAPEKQPELWKPEIYKKIYSMMNESGVLTTYCAKGQVKRDLLMAGFMVENLPGPPGKREIIRATRPPQNS